VQWLAKQAAKMTTMLLLAHMERVQSILISKILGKKQVNVKDTIKLLQTPPPRLK